jgi:hypothetical protein
MHAVFYAMQIVNDRPMVLADSASPMDLCRQLSAGTMLTMGDIDCITSACTRSLALAKAGSVADRVIVTMGHVPARRAVLRDNVTYVQCRYSKD